MSAALSLAAIERPASGAAVEVAPRVVWVRMPLPYALDHVNLWLLDDGDAWTLVDTGHGDDATRAAWDGLAATVLGGRPIRRVICTHHHPDHVGLAGWMAARWGAELWATRTEWTEARALGRRTYAEARAAATPFYRRAGIPAAALAAVLDCSRSYTENVTPVPSSCRRLGHGDELVAGGLRWRVLVGRGHSPEHACLHAADGRLFVSGDQVLPHITPNVSLWPRAPDEDPLADFLATAGALRTIPADTLVLPSHGRPFVGLRRRCDALVQHHRERLDAVLAACERPRTAFEVMTVLFDRALDAHQTTFAIGEAIAHLNHLVAQGALRRERRAREPDRYARAVEVGRAQAARG
jgi:glyoxylase-like metal-dependent hydrolase (beta-lactamase superfamily II)